jgi:hypothetical protein
MCLSSCSLFVCVAMAVVVAAAQSKDLAEQLGRVVYPLLGEGEGEKREEVDKALLAKEDIAEFLHAAAGNLGLLLKVDDESGTWSTLPQSSFSDFPP